jgi:hypothetical protein
MKKEKEKLKIMKVKERRFIYLNKRVIIVVSPPH